MTDFEVHPIGTGEVLRQLRAEREELTLRVAELEATLRAIANGVIKPPMMTEQARQMMQWQDLAEAVLTKQLKGTQ